MIVFLDALSDAWGQMTGTLAFVAQAFGENWRTGLAALLDRPTALFYVVVVVAVLVLAFSVLTVGSRIGYQRGRFLSANEKIFLRTLMRRSAATIARSRKCGWPNSRTLPRAPRSTFAAGPSTPSSRRASTS
jgi:hypothetical protein